MTTSGSKDAPDLDHLAREVVELERLEKAATAAPWTTEKPERDPATGFPRGMIIAATARGQGVYANPPGGSFPEPDRQLIAAMRNALPTLLTAVKAALSKNDSSAAGAAPIASTAEWLPIASAPKDGRIDLWGVACEQWTDTPRAGSTPQRWTGCDWDENHWRCGAGFIKPTHWREPPPPPIDSYAGQGPPASVITSHI